MSSLTDDEKVPRQIENTDLPWTTPPLTTSLTLGRADLQSYFDVPLPVGQEDLIRFWKETLVLMDQSPSRLLHRGVLVTTKGTMPYVKPGTRAFRFSTPLGYPDMLSPDAGVVFSLEVAHAAYISLGITERVMDQNNYYVTLRNGVQIGVKDGRPCTPCAFDFDASGMVLDLLETSRGTSNQTCMYDQLAFARSLLHSHADKFRRDFEAIDYALQALRYLTQGGYCPDLITRIQQAPQDLRLIREQSRAVLEAIDTMHAEISDKSKLMSIEATLVPLVMKISAFRATIFSSPSYPFTMEAGKTEKITTALTELYERLQCKLEPTA